MNYDLERKRIFGSREDVFKENVYPFLLTLDEQSNMNIVMNEISLVEKEGMRQDNIYASRTG